MIVKVTLYSGFEEYTGMTADEAAKAIEGCFPKDWKVIVHDEDYTAIQVFTQYTRTLEIGHVKETCTFSTLEEMKAWVWNEHEEENR